MAEFAGLAVAAVGLGVLHGVLPDHGWPIAAMYALEQTRRWGYAVAAGLILGVGHLFSSLVLVGVYFLVEARYDLVGAGWIGIVAGVVLILLGVRELTHAYRGEGHGHGHGHSHGDVDGHGHSHGHSHGDIDGHKHEQAEGGHESEHTGADSQNPILDNRHDSLLSIGWIALVLGFAHEEPIQIIAICAGTEFCLELMVLYSLAVIVAILLPTLLLVAGYERYTETVEKYTPYLPQITGVVLIAVGSGFVLGLF